MSQTIKEVKASTESVLKLTIKPANGWDWLQVYLEDYGHSDNGRHAGRLVLAVSGDAYTHYWSHMSNPLIEFVQTASNGYLINKLTGGELKKQIDATGDEMQSELIKTIFEQRRDDEISKEAARELYDDIHLADWERPTDEQELLYRIYGCEWWECIPKVDNPEYEHFSKVIDLLKQGLAQHIAGQGASQKATKYDWSNVPPEVKWRATDSCGYAWSYTSEPKCSSDQWIGDMAKGAGSCIEPLENPYKGDWRESLEQHPAQGGAL